MIDTLQVLIFVGGLIIITLLFNESGKIPEMLVSAVTRLKLSVGGLLIFFYMIKERGFTG